MDRRKLMTHRMPARFDRAGAGFAQFAAHRRHVGAALALVALLIAGCQTPPYCQDLGKCGGDVLRGGNSADWVVTGPDTCMDQVETPQKPLSSIRQPAKPVGERSIERTTFDWCSAITLKQDGSLQQFHGIDVALQELDFWYPTVPIRDGAVAFASNGTYTSRLTQFSPQSAELSASCLTAQGVVPNCPALGRQMREFVAAQLKGFPDAHLNLQFLRCYENKGGCTCDYDVTNTSAPAGPWAGNGSTLTFFDAAFKPPSLTDYCASGSTLELTGQNGTRLFNDGNVRTLRYRPSTCEDGVKGQAEEGVDCGGPCPNACPKCDDALKNGDEEGVDCGGSCPEMCECFDKTQNAWEEGVDCGGPCAAQCPMMP
jgi:hypothetical protein